MSAKKALPGYIGVSTVATQSFEHMRVEAYFDGQASIMFDEPAGFDIGEPPELRGQSRGWTPVHAQLAALAGCTAITVTVVARDQQFRYSGLRTGLTSLIDIRGFFFDLHLRPEYKQLTFDLTLKTRASAKKIAALAAETHRRCPQLGLFDRAGIPMLVRWFRDGDTAPVIEERLHMASGPTPEEQLASEAKPEPRKARTRRPARKR
jgi:uncharacterized OsmC-like protein